MESCRFIEFRGKRASEYIENYEEDGMKEGRYKEEDVRVNT